MKKNIFNKKKFKYGTVATAITVFIIVIIIFLNLIAGIFTEKKGLKLDLTAQNFFDISQDTIDYIKNIDSDVEIAVMQKKSELESYDSYKMIVENLNKYEQNSDHITVNYYDVAENPDIVNKYAAIYNGEIRAGAIIIACGDRVKVTSVDELFTINVQNYYQTGNLTFSGYKGEQILTSAIMNVTDSNRIRIALLTMYNGAPIYHGDVTQGLASFVGLLDKNGYEFAHIDLLTDEISPDDYDLAILTCPVSDLTDDSIKKIEDFLYNNGNLDKDMIYISDVSQRKTPKIDEFLEVWGMEVGGNQVIESDTDKNQQINLMRNTDQIPESAKAPVAEIASEEFSEGLSNTKLPIVAPATRNINLLFESNVDRDTTSILKTSAGSVLRPLNLQEQSSDDANALMNGEEVTDATEETQATTKFDIETAEKSENIVMAMTTKTNMDANDQQHANNLLVIGSASFTDPCITSTAAFNNAEFIINTVNKMCDKERTAIIIEEKLFDTAPLSITSSKLSLINKIVVFIIPLVVVVCGVLVGVLRRRNR